MSTAAFPKPKDQKRQPVSAVHVRADGREICDKNTSAGRAEYRRRVEEMRVRQDRRCCLEFHAPMCPGALFDSEATFEHERGRGAGKRDDRTALPSGQRINGAAHLLCNSWKGSRFIDYNRGLRNG